MQTTHTFPQQKLSFSRKNKKWRQSVVDWADKKSYIWNEGVRKSYYNKKINYDLWNGIVHTQDMRYYLNPYNHQSESIPDNIQHYSIINDLLGVLIGEEYNKKFDFFVRVSNMDAISSKEDKIKEMIMQRMQSLMASNLPPEKQQEELKKVAKYFKYEYQDIREIRANNLVNHYLSELDFKIKVNEGFKDALIVGEEIYQFDIVSNEPVFVRLNPNKVHCLRTGRSSRIEDSDIIIIEDFWSPGKIMDQFHDVLTEHNVKEIDEIGLGQETDSMKNISEADFWVRNYNEELIDGFIDKGGLGNGYSDSEGNIRVLKVYWKSKRKVQKVTSFDLTTGEELIEYKDENYIPNPELGESAKPEWINEAWEGTKIGKSIYVNMRPRIIQYNRLSNPSVCHFGIIGQIYNTNQETARSLLDRMKSTGYLFDVVYDKLVKTLAKDGGKGHEVDLAKIPAGWKMEKWLYFLRKDGLAFVDSFKEGNKGQSIGKVVGTMNNGTGKPVDMSQGDVIQQYSNLLIYLKSTLQDLSGVSDQRKGATKATETASGVERSVVQSSHITQELFAIHDNVKKRLIECLLETSKIALKGNKKKLQFIGDDYSNQLFEIDGDEFAECDYGIIVDQDSSNNELKTKIEQLAHAWSQNETVSPATILKIMKGVSLSKAIKDVESDMADKAEQTAKDMEMQQQQVMAQIQQQADEFDKQMAFDYYKVDEDNQTKLLIAGMSAIPDEPDAPEGDSGLDRAKFEHQKTVDNSKLNLDNRKLAETVRSNKAKETIARNKPKTTTSKK